MYREKVIDEIQSAELEGVEVLEVGRVYEF